MNKKRYNNGVEFRSQSTLSPGSKDLSIFSPASLRLNRAKSPLLAVLLLVCGASLHAVLTDSALADSGDIIFDGRINKSGDIPGGRANRDPTEREISRRVVTESADQYAAESIFNDEKPRPIKTATQPYVERRIRSSIAGSERRMERKMAIAEADTNLYDQMRQVANWLSQYCIWNRHWPDPGDQENDAIRQLNDLCPNNPYQSSRIQESSGFSTDPIYQYYSGTVGDAPDSASGYEADSLEPTTTYGALGDKRVRLVFDPSLTGVQAETWKESAPDDWTAPPGTITAISNSNNLIVVWAAGADGRPLRIPGQSRIRLFVTSVNMPTEERSGY